MDQRPYIGETILAYNPSLNVYYWPINDVRIHLPMMVCVLVVWSRLFYFLMGFDSSGPLIVTIYRITTEDIPYFLIYYMIILIAFACALSLFANGGNPDASIGFQSLYLSIWSCIQEVAIRNSPISEIEGTAIFSEMLKTLFTWISILIMISILICMIDDTNQKYALSAKSLLLLEKYNIMAEFQRSMSPNEINEEAKKYAILIKISNEKAINHSIRGSNQSNQDHIYRPRNTLAFQFTELRREWWYEEQTVKR